MPVRRQVPRSEVTDETVLAYYNRLFGDRDPVAEPGTATGTPGDWWTVYALSPDIFKHAVDGFAVYRNPARSIARSCRCHRRRGSAETLCCRRSLPHGGCAPWQREPARRHV